MNSGIVSFRKQQQNRKNDSQILLQEIVHYFLGVLFNSIKLP
jgi:hypothetical protein